MGQRDHLGEFEHVVLIALARIDGDAYGASIHREILDATGRDVSIPAVYVTLNRMERRGLMASRVGVSEASGGRARRNYRILRAGQDALERARALLEALWEGANVPAPVRTLS